jgi:hypothetical protein
MLSKFCSAKFIFPIQMVNLSGIKKGTNNVVPKTKIEREIPKNELEFQKRERYGGNLLPYWALEGVPIEATLVNPHILSFFAPTKGANLLLLRESRHKL